MSAQPSAPTAGHGWIRSPGWDLFWMFSALWGLALLFGLSEALDLRRAWLLILLPSGMLALWHSWSTTYMVLGSPLLRDQRHRNLIRYRVIPLLIVGICLVLGVGMGVSGAYPTGGPLDPSVWPWVLYLSLFWVGHFWHFGKQDFGVLSIYRLKAEQTRLLDRRVDYAYAVAMMFVIQPIVYFAFVPRSPFSEAFYSFMPIQHELLVMASTVCVVAASVFTVGAVVFELLKPNTSVQKLLYYGVMLTHPLLLYFIFSGLAYFYFVAYFWSHWFIAIGLVARINTGYYRAGGEGRAISIAHHILVLGAVTGAVTLFQWDYRQFALFSGGNYKNVLATTEAGQGAIVAFFLSFHLAEQLLHYYCDSCLFRFRDPGVRKAVLPLV
jgi:hypothetical protein